MIKFGNLIERLKSITIEAEKVTEALSIEAPQMIAEELSIAKSIEILKLFGAKEDLEKELQKELERKLQKESEEEFAEKQLEIKELLNALLEIYNFLHIEEKCIAGVNLEVLRGNIIEILEAFRVVETHKELNLKINILKRKLINSEKFKIFSVVNRNKIKTKLNTWFEQIELKKNADGVDFQIAEQIEQINDYLEKCLDKLSSIKNTCEKSKWDTLQSDFILAVNFQFKASSLVDETEVILDNLKNVELELANLNLESQHTDKFEETSEFINEAEESFLDRAKDLSLEEQESLSTRTGTEGCKNSEFSSGSIDCLLDSDSEIWECDTEQEEKEFLDSIKEQRSEEFELSIKIEELCQDLERLSLQEVEEVIYVKVQEILRDSKNLELFQRCVGFIGGDKIPIYGKEWKVPSHIKQMLEAEDLIKIYDVLTHAKKNKSFLRDKLVDKFYENLEQVIGTICKPHKFLLAAQSCMLHGNIKDAKDRARYGVIYRGEEYLVPEPIVAISGIISGTEEKLRENNCKGNAQEYEKRAINLIIQVLEDALKEKSSNTLSKQMNGVGLFKKGKVDSKAEKLYDLYQKLKEAYEKNEINKIGGAYDDFIANIEQLDRKLKNLADKNENLECGVNPIPAACLLVL